VVSTQLPGALPWSVKQPGREAGHSPTTSAGGQENLERSIHSPIRLYGVALT
jgi:hypothetical protein